MKTRFLFSTVLALASASCATTAGLVAMNDLVANRVLAISPTELFDKPNDAQLADSVGKGELKRAQELIDRGADVNANGRQAMTPLLWALGKRNIDGFRFLLDHGADANAVTCCDEKAEGMVHKLSAMGLSARIENPDYLQALLDHGGNPNLAINEAGETPIFSTLLENRFANVRLLIKAGADLNHQDVSQGTPIAEAAGETNYAMALLLLQSGADPTLKNRWGYSTVDDLMKYGNRGALVLHNPRDVTAYDQFVAELKQRGILKADPPHFCFEHCTH